MSKNKKKKKLSFFGRLFDPKMWLIDFVKLTGALPALVDLRMKRLYFSGKKPKKFYRGKYIVSSNHSSFTDPVVITAFFWMRRISFVATKEIFEIKGWGKFFKGCGCIKVDRENVSMQTFKQVTERLDRGHLICVFPEGTVSRDEQIHTFKSGIVMMSFLSGADIMPVYIAKSTSWIQRQVVVFGDKIKLDDYIKSPMPSINDIENVSNVLREKELELEAKYNEYLNRKAKKKKNNESK